MQSRMDPGEADSQREKRLKQIKDGSDDESMILAELEERKIFDGRSTKNK